ncbi:hypothetical protein J5226_20250 [Lysobacter sp. K5869]|uniref:hypothetical protein n=1 Tax=Lysobacter sp. K5869 TaxID=2820808 RepID=UPI001C060964|nr:hypothetical protein [Lysobacter sp. K5869]QWP75913.1 hypothetical protein J5226_20250 [Lysobacter sp. K5869]
MRTLLLVVLSLHVLAAVFWAGGSFAIARLGGGAARLQAPMLGAAIATFVSGGYLWRATHGAAFGRPETVLAVGIACALAAFVVQLGVGARARWALARATQTEAPTHAALAARLAAVLLAVAAVCMAAARYA